MQEKLVYCCTY